MDFIAFRCSSCNQGLKIGTDKAGRKIKCSKCGTILTVPRAGSQEGKAAAPAGLAPEEPAKQVEEEEENDKKGYGLFVDPTEGLEKEPEIKVKKDEVKAPQLKR